jgi:hypothetical protein
MSHLGASARPCLCRTKLGDDAENLPLFLSPPLLAFSREGTSILEEGGGRQFAVGIDAPQRILVCGARLVKGPRCR